MEKIHTNLAPAAIGPYSQAIKTGDYLFISGQLGIDPKTGELASGVEEQTKQVLKNLDAILAASHCNRNQVVRCTIFIKDMNTFKIVNDIYANFFGDHKPSRSTIEVARLPKDGLIEIDAIALCK